MVYIIPRCEDAGCEGNWKYLFNRGNGFGAQPLDKWPINVQGGRGGVYARRWPSGRRETIRRETRNNWRTTRKFRNAHLAIIYYYFMYHTITTITATVHCCNIAVYIHYTHTKHARPSAWFLFFFQRGGLCSNSCWCSSTL